MRATLITCAITLAVFVFAATAYGGDCDTFTSCSTCVARSNCGWCSDWSGCMAGSTNGPFSGKCSAWHPSSCAGVASPRVSKCYGSPISPERVRKLIGSGNNYATIASNVKWTDQSRKCNSVTGCSDWMENAIVPPTANISLLASQGTVYLNILTGNCTQTTCSPSGYQLPLINTARLVGIQSSQVGQSSLTFNHWSVPFYSCQGSECTAYAWTAASGTSRFTLTAELTDNCLHIASDYSSDPSSQPAVDFIELIVNF